MEELAAGTLPNLNASKPVELFDWPTDSQSYQLLGKIGRGAFATVWKAVPKTTLATTSAAAVAQQHAAAAAGSEQPQSPLYECAVKILNLDHVDSDLQEIRREVQSMRLSSHPNILTCYTAFVYDIHLWLVTPLMRKGSSLHCLQTARRYNCPTANAMEPHIFFILQQSLLGLQYIHDNHHIHRDMKGGNILLDSDGSVRIADFGVSQFLDPHFGAGVAAAKARTFVGTPCWMAPEVMEQHADGYDTKADVWSLGITALELAKGYAPYAKYPPMKVLILTIQEDPPSLATYLTLEENDDDDHHDPNNNPQAQQGGGQPNPNSRTHQPFMITEKYSKLFSSFVDQCLQKMPSRRPSCAELLQHRALQGMTNNPQHLQERQQNLCEQVCNYVPDVGAQNSEQPMYNQRLHEQVKIVTSPSQALQNEEPKRQKGTTWVFSDGSQVLSSTALKSGESMSVDDVFDQLDEFEKETGGEHYNKQQEPPLEDLTQKRRGDQQQQQQQFQRLHHHDEDDDMNDFLDDLEQTLPGEDYQHPASGPGSN
ncbi:hypothetical protein ACA910_006729 [Epithemia clementina (nom. ined.)]